MVDLLLRENADGTHRWYHKIAVPCVHGDQSVLLPLFHEPRKGSAAIRIRNRGEYLRAFPTNTMQHKILYGRRNDTESRHRQDKRTQPKMVAYGPEAQSLYNLGGAVFDNAMFRGHRLKRAGLPNPLDAT